MAGFLLRVKKRGIKLEKYEVLSVEHSIICPNMLDVEVGKNGRLVKSFRVSAKLKNVKPGVTCIMHHNIALVPIAYCFGNEMYLVNAPKNRNAAQLQMSAMLGLMDGCSDKWRFYLAMRAALKNQGKRPALTATGNMLRLAALQQCRRIQR